MGQRRKSWTEGHSVVRWGMVGESLDLVSPSPCLLCLLFSQCWDMSLAFYIASQLVYQKLSWPALFFLFKNFMCVSASPACMCENPEGTVSQSRAKL